ncbi:MAG: serine dehydratase subunit alpha family protein [Lachnospiraceae bacterium]|nr:serine dehydratase subunit alpha family protein [Lachnospiraceae bacterium]
MKPALGVTEPAAIALACARARALSKEPPKTVTVRVNSGIFKNAFTCGIPNTCKVGNEYAAALGCWFGRPDQELLVLDAITEEDVQFCEGQIEQGNVTVFMGEISPDISIQARVTTEHDVCEAEIRHRHTNVCYLCRNQVVLLDEREKTEDAQGESSVSLEEITLEQMFVFASQASEEELEFIREAYRVNRSLAEAGLASDRCTFTKALFQDNESLRISEDAEKTAVFFAGAAAEARVLGLNHPAMSITGSGNHGIISTLPLYAVAKAEGYSDLTLLRATALSYLVTMYIKQYSGILSALCGCAVAAGTGMACGIAMLRGGDLEAVVHTLYNMTNSIVGMICQGGNHGCVMKVISAVKTGFSAAKLGLSGLQIEACHGIGGETPEETMRNIGRIANPGMVQTEETIVEIMGRKNVVFPGDSL